MNPTLLLDHDAPASDGSLVLRALLRIESEARASGGRVPLNLSLVLDRSGSMNGEPLAAATEAAALVVRRLWPEDVVSVVAYDDEVRVVAPPAAGREQADVGALLRSLESGGMTNLSGGWLRGRELVAQGLRTQGVNRVLLLTDGLANVGITEPDRLAGLFREAADRGITTSTIGFGEGFDERLLRALADAGRGNAYYVEEAEQAPGVFEEELEGLLGLTAQNLVVTLTLGSGASLGRVHHSYPSRETPTGLALELGDLYAREPRALLVEVRVEAPVGDPVDVATLVLSGDVLTADGGVERRVVTLPITLSAVDGPRVDPEVRRELLLQATARAREEALEREARGEYGAAADALRVASTAIRDAGLDDAALTEEAEDLDAMAVRSSQGPLAAADSKYLAQRSYDTSRSRSTATERIRRKRGGGD